MNRMNCYSYSIIGTIPEVAINYLKYKKKLLSLYCEEPEEADDQRMSRDVFSDSDKPILCAEHHQLQPLGPVFAAHWPSFDIVLNAV